MSEGYEEDLAMYEEVARVRRRQLDNQVLMRPISDLDYPKEPASVGPDAPVRDAIEIMSTLRSGALPVVEGTKVVGIITERDLLLKGVYVGKSLQKPVREFMTQKPVCLTPHDSIAHALSRMVIGGYRHIPLIDASGNLAGLLIMRDVMRYVVSFFPEELLSLPPHSVHAPPERNVEGG